MPELISTVVLMAALYVIICRPEDKEARDWAIAVVGVLLGYWLK